MAQNAMIWFVRTSLLSAVFASQHPRLPIVKNEIKSINVTCNADSFNITVSLEHPFKGMLSAKDFSRECNSFGSLKKSVTLNLPTYGCGVRLSTKKGTNGELVMEYSVTLAIQQDRHLRQAADQEIRASCRINSEEFSLKSQTMFNELEADLFDGNHDVSRRRGRMRQYKSLDLQEHNDKHMENIKYDDSIGQAKAWMEIIPEENPNDSPKNDKLRVGETAKLIVKSTLPEGIGWQVVDCTAHDGLGDSSQKLLDDRGCPIDEQIMPRPKYGPVHDNDLTKYQEAITIFPAFKFPDRDRLHMTCMLVLCRNACKQADCGKNKDFRLGKTTKEKDHILDHIKIFNSVEVLAPTISEYYKTKEYQDSYSSPHDLEGLSQDETLCISYHKVAIAFCILGVLFLIATVIATRGFLRSRRPGNAFSVYTRSIFSSSSATGSSHFGSKLLHDHSSFGFSTGGLQYGRI